MFKAASFRAVSFRAAAASRVGLGTALATLGHVAEHSLAVRLPGPVPGAQNVSVTDVPLDRAIPKEVWARSSVHSDLAKVLNSPGYCQGNSCKFTGEGGCELSGKISLCIVVSRKQTSHKVEWRTWFILVFTPDTFYDNRK